MKRLLDLLDSVAKWPAMYTGTVTFDNVDNFLRGLQTGAELAGIEYSREQFLAAALERGWDPRSAIGIRWAFEQNGLSEVEMAHELIAVVTAAYRKALQSASIQGPTG